MPDPNGQSRVRAISAVAIVLIFAAIVYVQRTNNRMAAIAVIPRLDCRVSDAFSAAMGHTQPLHDRAGAVSVKLASIMPNVALASWNKPTDFDSAPYGRLVASICATDTYEKLGISAGAPGNELWLRHTGAGDAAENWMAYVRTVGSNDFHPLVVYKRDTADDATQHPPGHAQWISADEDIWVSCSRGCCYVTGGGRDTTK